MILLVIVEIVVLIAIKVIITIPVTIGGLGFTLTPPKNSFSVMGTWGGLLCQPALK